MIIFRIKQVLKEKILIFSFLILMLISLGQFFSNIWSEQLINPNAYPTSLYYAWILSNDGNSFFPFLYLFSVFPLTALPMGFYLNREGHSQYDYIQIIRKNRKKYLLSLLSVNSLLAFGLATIPLLFNVFFNALRYPALKPYRFADYMRAYPRENGTIAKNLFLEHPFLNIIVYVLLTGIIAILISNLILLLGLFIKKTIYLFALSLLIPLVLFLIPGDYSLSPLGFLVVSSGSNNVYFFPILALIASFGLLALFLFMYYVKKRGQIS